MYFYLLIYQGPCHEGHHEMHCSLLKLANWTLFIMQATQKSGNLGKRNSSDQFTSDRRIHVLQPASLNMITSESDLKDRQYQTGATSLARSHFKPGNASMSSEQAPFPAGGSGLLRGNRSRSYGSLVRSPLSPVRQGRIEHQVQPGDTLQGLSLKYGVSMEQIKRANRLYTNDSIFLKKSLFIPVLTDPDSINNGVEQGTSQSAENDYRGDQSHSVGHAIGVEGESDISPMDFLKRMDRSINKSKQAATRNITEGEKGFSNVDQFHPRRASASQVTESHSHASSPRTHQWAMLGAVPLTITKHTKKLKDREDDIFEL
ncbi:hypothetical protein SKAU_G00221940 [Synaphobranchus kaupii]|uniref:LysM and putative peptidoglycan-binding domain-containing protein 1 n=1 Tax=Synaphobranchus kaupii TaxID=118154 RepID=A0A9Q1FB64_SYNKA|nr:hypothetical protein SKAU_G00221940 [Synaphobranchus kaupii]